MRNIQQRLAFGTIAFIGFLAFDSSSALAQATYVDVPFNQGGLFYRPGGLMAPRPRVARAPLFVAPTSGFVAAAPTTVLLAPRQPRVLYPRVRRPVPRYYRWTY